VVAVGVTAALAPVTVPGPGLTDRDVLPVTVQASVADPPGTMVEGVAVNDEITGAAGAGVPPPLGSPVEPPPQAATPALARTTARR
jgi:hypothetical protein